MNSPSLSTIGPSSSVPAVNACLDLSLFSNVTTLPSEIVTIGGSKHGSQIVASSKLCIGCIMIGS